MGSQGRVRLWISNNCGISKMIEFSAYGSYLEHQGDRLVDFNERGIRIISQDGRVLWHKDQRFQDCEGVVRDDNKAAKMELSVAPIWYGKLPGEGSESHVRRKEEDSLIAVGPVWQIVPAT
jgi:hypothetical protein